MEEAPAYQQFNLKQRHNEGDNLTAAVAGRGPAAVVASYLCPTNPLRQGTQETNTGYKPDGGPNGKFGYTDYAVLPYVEIKGTANATAIGLPEGRYKSATSAASYPIDNYNGQSGKKFQLLDSATLATKGFDIMFGGSTVTQISDGSSKSILAYEDTGRTEQMPHNTANPANDYTDPVDGQGRAHWRWAEPDCSSGCSLTINNNATPTGGPSTCPWKEHDCGPNNEWFSFHPGGAHALFADGHVDFVSDNTSLRVVILMGIRDDGQNYTTN
jgi:prepilin-type processing-associated H-X9-DG protein